MGQAGSPCNENFSFIRLGCIGNLHLRTILFHFFRFLAAVIIFSSAMLVQPLMFSNHIIHCLSLDFVPSVLPINIHVRTSSLRIKYAHDLHSPFSIIFTKQGFDFDFSLSFLSPISVAILCLVSFKKFHSASLFEYVELLLPWFCI